MPSYSCIPNPPSVYELWWHHPLYPQLTTLSSLPCIPPSRLPRSLPSLQPFFCSFSWRPPFPLCSPFPVWLCQVPPGRADSFCSEDDRFRNKRSSYDLWPQSRFLWRYNAAKRNSGVSVQFSNNNDKEKQTNKTKLRHVTYTAFICKSLNASMSNELWALFFLLLLILVCDWPSKTAEEK